LACTPNLRSHPPILHLGARPAVHPFSFASEAGGSLSHLLRSVAAYLAHFRRALRPRADSLVRRAHRRRSALQRAAKSAALRRRRIIVALLTVPRVLYRRLARPLRRSAYCRFDFSWPLMCRSFTLPQLWRLGLEGGLTPPSFPPLARDSSFVAATPACEGPSRSPLLPSCRRSTPPCAIPSTAPSCRSSRPALRLAARRGALCVSDCPRRRLRIRVAPATVRPRRVLRAFCETCASGMCTASLPTVRTLPLLHVVFRPHQTGFQIVRLQGVPRLLSKVAR
jgi:hypothetical protein